MYEIIAGRMSDRVLLCLNILADMRLVKNAPGGRALELKLSKVIYQEVIKIR